jgi:uncharacterized protein
MSPSTFLLLVLLGAGVGVFGTLVGAGGGFILTPVLLLFYPRDTPTTITAISLTVVFFNATSGSLAFAWQHRIDYRTGIWFAIATLPGAVAGALIVGAAPRHLFDALMGLLLSGLAIWLLTSARGARARAAREGDSRVLTDSEGTTHRYSVMMGRGFLYSVLVGFVSSFLGIGGGVIHVPVLVRALGLPVHIATATSHFVLANMSAVGTLTHVAVGDFSGGTGLHRSLALSLGVIAGAQVGARVSQRVTGRLIQRLLALALAGLAIRLFLSAL